ncbi:MAG: hypothetical protein CMB46_03570 [Euryarchaeota archaeon]|nr:hypothetical protein [Euryarchaeota archaeon]
MKVRKFAMQKVGRMMPRIPILVPMEFGKSVGKRRAKMWVPSNSGSLATLSTVPGFQMTWIIGISYLLQSIHPAQLPPVKAVLLSRPELYQLVLTIRYS